MSNNTSLQKFYLTFGNKYRNELHPSGIVINPDGYVVITSHTYDEAREIALANFGNNWSFLYAEEDFNKSYFPAGILLEVTQKSI